MAMTYKKRLFVRELLQCGNQTQAAIAAGVPAASAQSMGSQWMAQPEVQQYFNECLQIVKDEMAMDAVDVHNELAKVAGATVLGIFHPDGRIKAPHELDEATAAAIQAIKVTDLGVGIMQYEYKFHPKLTALDSISKHLNLYEQHKKAGATDIHINIDEKDAKA